MSIVLSSSTASAGTIRFSVESGFVENTTVRGQDTGGTFTADIEYTLDGGTTWTDVYVNGTQVQCSNTNTHVPINMVGDYRVTWSGQPATTVIEVVR
jgi:hypothetical protein